MTDGRRRPGSVFLPPPARPGDRVGVAALSSAVDADALEDGLDALRGLGFEPVPAANLGRRAGLFAGSDDERLQSFHDLALDPELTAIFFARGGHGVMRVLPQIDWPLLATTPRAYVGYSDLTPFLAQIPRRLGHASFHGPMVASDLARELEADEVEALLGALSGEALAALPLAGACGSDEVEAPLSGGCLSLLTATQGTPFAPELDGCLMFWEDVNEPLYRLDRMLTHLRLSGTLARIRGMVVGHADVADAEEVGDDALIDLLESTAAEFGWPVGWGLPSGHGRPNLTLPLGLTARLDPTKRCLEWVPEAPA